jgi:hypothetical protein
MDFKDWLTEMERIAAPQAKQVASPSGMRKPTMKAVTPAHLGAKPNPAGLSGLNIFGQTNYVKKPPKTIKRPSDS